jgi:hypothetical protein
MARLKLEDVKQLSEPIIIEAGILGDKEYTVEKITTEILDEVNKLAPKDVAPSMDMPIKQLAILLGVPAAEIQANDLRMIGKVLNFIMGEVTRGLDTVKNPS